MALGLQGKRRGPGRGRRGVPWAGLHRTGARRGRRGGRHVVRRRSDGAGVTGFLKTVAREVAGDGVTVNSVQPGIHATDRMRQLGGGSVDPAPWGIPAGFAGDPDDFGAVVAFLCGQQVRFITGAHIPVDGGAYARLL